MSPRKSYPSIKPLGAKQAARMVVRRLVEAGHEALLAGGCVRDMLRGKRPKDDDIATSARPEQVTALFRRTQTVGAQFGVVVVLLGRRQVEVATFRSEADYVDGRRPDHVVFTDARADAMRRDFTINGMFYDLPAEKVLDYVGGKKDLETGVIRAIGDPNERFGEDRLRMLRAVRFAARLNFSIEPATWKALCRQHRYIRQVSAERVMMELEHILTDPHRQRGGALARECGLLSGILGSVAAASLNVGIGVLGELPQRCSLALALAGLLSSCEVTQVKEICRDFKTSNELRKQTAWLVEGLHKLPAALPLSTGRLKQWLAQPLFGPLLTLWAATCRAAGEETTSIARLKRQIRELGAEPIAPPRLLDGHDLIELGTPAGPLVGRLVEELYLAQLENQVTSRAQARRWVADWLNKMGPAG